jgi:hypothetical protein
VSPERITIDAHEAAVATALELTIVQRYAENGLIAPQRGYGEDDLAELRRVRRLLEDLELDHPAVEIVLRMRRNMIALQAEVQRLQAELRRARGSSSRSPALDEIWEDL